MVAGYANDQGLSAVAYHFKVPTSTINSWKKWLSDCKDWLIYSSALSSCFYVIGNSKLKVQGHTQICALYGFEMGALFQTLSNRKDLDTLICTESKAD